MERYRAFFFLSSGRRGVGNYEGLIYGTGNRQVDPGHTTIRTLAIPAKSISIVPFRFQNRGSGV